MTALTESPECPTGEVGVLCRDRNDVYRRPPEKQIDLPLAVLAVAGQHDESRLDDRGCGHPPDDTPLQSGDEAQTLRLALEHGDDR